MSARTPRKKPTGKAKPPPAVPPLVTTLEPQRAPRRTKKPHIAKDALYGWMERIPAQMDSLFAHLPSPDAASVPQLLADLERTMEKLYRLSDATPGTVDFSGLNFAMRMCFSMLQERSKLGGDKAEEAIDILLSATSHGCEILAEAATDEKSREVLKAKASLQAKWPVMQLPKTRLPKETIEYLRQIRVGTASTPPTAKSNIHANDPWTKLAVILIEKLIFSKGLLEIQARKERSTSQLISKIILSKGPLTTQALKKLIEEAEFYEASKWPDLPAHPFYRQLFEKELPEALKWKRVLDLPDELNKETWGKWWVVAEAMLKADWEADPAKKKKIFESIKSSAAGQIRTGKTDPVAIARSLQTESKNLIVKSVKEAFESIVFSSSWA